jgi:histidinol dehydrogenase
MRTFTWSQSGKSEILAALKRPAWDLAGYRRDVRPIIDAVRCDGDAAVRRFARQFDGVDLDQIRVPAAELGRALAVLPDRLHGALEMASENIRRFHREDADRTRCVETRPGVCCRRETRALESAGLYVPGGAAPLVSTVLMLGIPARLAGVDRVAVCTPPGKDGHVAGPILAACRLLKIEEVYAVGGAQAIAALAYGTQSIAKVAKIVGPGNIYVTAAKAEVSVDPEGAAIDMLAGPSELLVIADDTAEPAFVAADLLSQAEHDANSQIVLLTTSARLLTAVRAELERQSATLPRRPIAASALEKSAAVLVENLADAVEIANAYAPEHLSIQTARPEDVLATIRNAGSVFLGPYSPEAVGDYCSGTNHVLPTGGTARTQGGVSVQTFQKTMTVQQLTREGLGLLAETAALMARAEALEAHARAVEIRTP